MTIYDIPSITKSAFDVAITARNISADFAATGTWPVNTNIFGEADFLPSQVTDRPNPELEQSVSEIVDNPAERTITPDLNTGTIDNVEAKAITPGASIDQTMPSSNSSVVNNNANEPVASTSIAHTPVLNNNAIEPISSTSTAYSTIVNNNAHESVASTSSAHSPVLNNDANEPVASAFTIHSPLATVSNVFSSESVRPLPKAPPRKNCQPNRRKIKSAVFIDKPTKDEIAAIEANRKSKNVKKRVLSGDKKKPKKAMKTNKKKRTGDDERNDEENNCVCLVCLEAYANSRSNEEWVQ